VRTRLVKLSGSNGVSDSENSLPPSGQTLATALKSLVSALDARSVQYAIMGGIAAIQHSRARTTDDIDALLAIPQIALPGLFEALKSGGFAVDVVKSIREFRHEGLTTIRFGEVLIDLMRPILPVYAHVLSSAVQREILGQSVRIVSVEGLIVTKLIAFRPQDEADIRELLAAHSGLLDLNYIRNEFATVADKNDPRWAKFDLWLREASPVKE
jgi:predicted nucleotidyltransferase